MADNADSDIFGSFSAESTGNPRRRRRTVSSSISGEMESGPSNDELLKIIECPVCNDYPVSPIYACAKGHFTCNDCMKVLSACTVCQSRFTDVRNYALESIVDRTKFTCKYEYRGCPESVLGADYTKHVDECSYRMIPCFSCDDVVAGTDFLEHLCSQHNAGGKMVAPGEKFADNFVQQEDETYPPMYLVDETQPQRLFVLNTKKHKSFVCWWVTCLNPKEQDAKFTRLTWKRTAREETAENANNCSGYPLIQWNLPIHNTHKAFNEIRDSGQCAVLPSTHLEPFGNEDEETNWTIRFELIKKADDFTEADSGTDNNVQENTHSNSSIPNIALFAGVFFLGIAVAIVSGAVLQEFGLLNNNPEQEYHGYRGFYYETDENKMKDNHRPPRDGHRHHRKSKYSGGDLTPEEEAQHEDFIGHRGFYYPQAAKESSDSFPENNKLWKYVKTALVSIFGETGSKFPSRNKKSRSANMEEREDFITNLISRVFTISFSLFCIFAVLGVLTIYKGWLARDPLERDERERRFRLAADPDVRGFGDRMQNPNEPRNARLRDLLAQLRT